MKLNGKMTGSAYPTGLIQTEQVFSAWSKYYTKFINAYRAQGIDFWGLTIQNGSVDPFFLFCFIISSIFCFLISLSFLFHCFLE